MSASIRRRGLQGPRNDLGKHDGLLFLEQVPPSACTNPRSKLAKYVRGVLKRPLNLALTLCASFPCTHLSVVINACSSIHELELPACYGSFTPVNPLHCAVTSSINTPGTSCTHRIQLVPGLIPFVLLSRLISTVLARPRQRSAVGANRGQVVEGGMVRSALGRELDVLVQLVDLLERHVLGFVDLLVLASICTDLQITREM